MEDQLQEMRQLLALREEQLAEALAENLLLTVEMEAAAQAYHHAAVEACRLQLEEFRRNGGKVS